MQKWGAGLRFEESEGARSPPPSPAGYDAYGWRQNWGRMNTVGRTCETGGFSVRCERLGEWLMDRRISEDVRELSWISYTKTLMKPTRRSSLWGRICPLRCLRWDCVAVLRAWRGRRVCVVDSQPQFICILSTLASLVTHQPRCAVTSVTSLVSTSLTRLRWYETLCLLLFSRCVVEFLKTRCMAKLSVSPPAFCYSRL